MIPAPLTVDVRHGAIAGLSDLLDQGGLSHGGKVAVLVGPGLGREVAGLLSEQLPRADVLPVSAGSVDAARELSTALRAAPFDAVVGVGGGRTLDVTKYAASLIGMPMVAVPTNLAHDGIASPVASLEHGGRKESYGVHTPLAVLVDLDYVGRAPRRQLRAGIGDVLSNLSALDDWELAAVHRGEQIDGMAAAMARSAANAVIDRPDSIESDDFLRTLAESLILSGLAMSVAGSSRPCSGGDHEILHAVNQHFPDVSSHGELAGLGALFCTYLRGDEERLRRLHTCLRRHGLPCLPTEVGLTDSQFCAAVARAPTTRPDRYTILEHLAMDEQLAVTTTEAFRADVGDAAA